MPWIDYKPYASCDAETKALKLLDKHGTIRKAAKASGIARSTLGDRINRVKAEAIKRGYSPDHDLTHPAPAGMFLKGTSTLYDADGTMVMQWVKNNREFERQAEALEQLVESLEGRIKPARPVKRVRSAERNGELLNLYVLTDAHLGMYAHHEEGGSNWDLSIAEDKINEAFDDLSGRMPKASQAVLCELGDFLHSDGMFPVTPTSGHVLDQDSRYWKVIDTATRVLRGAIDKLLRKYDKVSLLICQGNHDPSTSIAIQRIFASFLSDEPRIDVLLSPLPYYAMPFGDVLLGFTHGHKAKRAKLPDVFTSEFRKLVGQTKQTFIHTGHFHSQAVEEFGSAIIEQHPTIAARDSHSSHGGWNSMRAMKAITYHSTRMEISRCTYIP